MITELSVSVIVGNWNKIEFAESPQHFSLAISRIYHFNLTEVVDHTGIDSHRNLLIQLDKVVPLTDIPIAENYLNFMEVSESLPIVEECRF